MCGLVFLQQANETTVSLSAFKKSLASQSWRGPDATGIKIFKSGKVMLGHNRLSILDLSKAANQPIKSKSSRFQLIFNGEIYNHLKLREKYNLNCRTNSDSETIIELFELIGIKTFEQIEGMYALVIFDALNNEWWATRDPWGIKPLYYSTSDQLTLIASEPSTINMLIPSKIDTESINELRLVRRPVPGFTFFKQIKELLPGKIISSYGLENFIARPLNKLNDTFDENYLFGLISDSVTAHEISDVPIVSLLSGGIDSALIYKLSNAKNAYCVGLDTNNEFISAKNTAKELGKNLNLIKINQDELKASWRHLCKLKGEPLNVPNEGLIYHCCKMMKKEEKVVLTGEGADEIFFGYDRIFRLASTFEELDTQNFLSAYSYSKTTAPTFRLLNYIEDLAKGKYPIEFTEDFFLKFHLTGLLRRMDFASMAASKEARVPFVNSRIIEYMFRRPLSLKIDRSLSKKPLRRLCEKLGLSSPLMEKKIGFSAMKTPKSDLFNEYKNFYDFCLGELNWL
jgi:asparagine synthase (glutamine-hydrolysing)